MKFGTSGLRGLSVDLVAGSAVYVCAFAEHLLASGLARKGDRVLVGRDFRESSPEIAGQCIWALRQFGLHPIDCGPVPTPALSLYGLELNAASVMITGSHIPADRNGIKFYRPTGEIDKNDELEITRIAAEMTGRGQYASAGFEEAENHFDRCAELFLSRNVAVLKADALAGLKIGVYQHSTVARDLLVDVLTHYGADVIPLGRSETFIPVDTEAVSDETTAVLSTWAKEYRLDMTVSADGDGDRPLLADENGAPLRGDVLGLLTAEFLGAKTVVTPVTSNSAIESAGSFSVVRTRVGSPYVISAMEEAVAAGKTHVLGFEANGGLLTASPFAVNDTTLRPLPTRDSFLPMLAVLSRAATLGKPLSAIVADLRLPHVETDRLQNFPVETSAALMSWLLASPANIAGFLAPLGKTISVNTVDGLRVVLEGGRIIHLRPSGNAPEMRCYVEANTTEAAHALLGQGLDLIRTWAASNADR